MKAIAFLCLILSGCSPKGAENPILSVERELGLNWVQGGEPLSFYSSKHVDVAEARRMMAALLYYFSETETLELIFDPIDGYVSHVVYEANTLVFYVWSEKQARRIKVREEPFDGLMERSFGKITRDQAPFLGCL